MIKRLMVIALFCVMIQPAYSQLRINEVMSSNTNTIIDEDGDDPDWLEIYNASPETMELTGLILSDSSNEWELPQMSLGSEQYLLIFASGKDRNQPPLLWNTIIDWGDTWKYTVPTANTSTEWYQPHFDDSSWSSGSSGFGYGDGDDNTELENVISVYLRKSFTITDLSAVEQLVLHMDYDDAFVAFINGTEVARENISTTGIPAYDQTADDYDHEAQMYQGLPPSTFPIENPQSLLQAGTNTIAIQVHNHSTGSSDFTAIPILSIGGTSGANQLSEHLTTIQANLHTNFELNADGETLLLLSPTGELIDSVTIPSIATDIAYGRKPDGTGEWHYFHEATPGKANSDTGYKNQSGEVNFSISGSKFSISQELTLSSNKPGDQIYYTIDGGEPSASGIRYSTPISISNTTSVRAQIVNEDALPGPIATHTFFIQTNHDLPIVSITTAPKNLWDEEDGIYAMGNEAEPETPNYGANFWKDWEKTVHFELIETNGERAVAQDVGMRIFGGWSRAHDQKSFSLHARKSLGDNTISHQIFANLKMDEFTSIVLRNSGNDWNYTMFRDALLTSLFHPSVDKQAYQPAVVYLNGEYWGIQNLREKVNEDFLAAHHNLDPDDIIILEGNGQPVEGDETSYLELTDYISSHNLSSTENFNYVAERMDIDNFIQYQIGNIFIDNKDWPGNNIKYWKSNQPGSKWRWISYDTDFGFAIYGEDPNFNTLDFALDPTGPDWPNPPWSTLFLRKLIQNQKFKQHFVNALCDQLNTTWQPANMISTISRMSDNIEGEIGQHMDRWGSNVPQWHERVERMKEYAEIRPGNVVNHFSNRFNLGAQHTITIDANRAQGHIQLNTLSLKSFPWSGRYFEGMEIELEAQPQPGYRFVRWEGSISSSESKTSLKPTVNANIKAIFELSDSNLGGIVINEINYNPSQDFDTEDWVELYNKSNEAINLSGWILQDDDSTHNFTLPDISIQSNEYLVICREKASFENFYTGLNTVGDLDFGLSGDKDCVRLFNALGEKSDEVCYQTQAPWVQANDGYTLGLKNPVLDNNVADNWFLIPENGNPGAPNEFQGKLLLHTNLKDQYSCYPNPLHGNSLYVQGAYSKETKFSLTTLEGKSTVLRIVRQDQKLTQLEVPQKLKAGLYILRIATEKQDVLTKIMIQQ